MQAPPDLRMELGTLGVAGDRKNKPHGRMRRSMAIIRRHIWT